MDLKKKFNILSAFCNLFIFVSVTWSVLYYFYKDTGAGNMDVVGALCFKYFTVDSNIMAAIASVIYLYFNFARLCGKEVQIPRWLKVFKFVATNSVAVTFFVVLLCLVPVGYFMNDIPPVYFYEENCIILHLFAPLFAMLTVSLFEKEDQINKKYTYISFAPVLLYGIVYFVCVVIAKCWKDHYGLTFEGNYYLTPIAVLMIFGICYGSSELVYYLQTLCNNKLKDKKENI